MLRRYTYSRNSSATISPYRKEYIDIQITAAIITGTATIIAAFVGIWLVGRPTDDPKISTDPKESKRHHRYDIFVSAPLAGFATDKEIQADHDRVLPLVKCLEKELGLEVFWAGRNICSRADFEAADIAVVDDVQAIRDSKYFLLLYPNKIVSSVLFEAGIALRSCLVSIYIVKNKEDLPFLMDSAAQAFLNVRTYTSNLPEDALTLIRNHGKRFFEPRGAPDVLDKNA